MRASVLFEQGKPLSIEELDLEPPRAGEVLVRMAATRKTGDPFGPPASSSIAPARVIGSGGSAPS
jgi:hypothetical protein